MTEYELTVFVRPHVGLELMVFVLKLYLGLSFFSTVLVTVLQTVPYGLHTVNTTVSVNSCCLLPAPHTHTPSH